MSRPCKSGKHYYRLVPCPSYEITKMEAWLTDLAKEGLLLTNDGIFAGVAVFEYKGPQKVKYRLEAARNSTGMWADNYGEPDPEQIEISKRYSWEYTAKLRDFYVYRSFDPEARELNTDPEVQATALEAVKKRAGSSLVSSLLLLFVYPIVLTRGCLLLTAISMGTGWMILALILGLLLVAGEVRAFVHLKKCQQSLQREGCFRSDSDWKKERNRHFSRKIVMTVMGIFLVWTLLRAWGVSITDENKIPLREYQGTVPFATMKDFAGDGCADYSLTMAGLYSGINTIEEKTDWIAPRCIEYNEHAEVKRADGLLMDGGLYVDYCELRSPFLAKVCAREFYRQDRLSRGLEPMKTPGLDADYVVAYRSNVHFPTVIIQKGCTVVKVSFFQTSAAYTMPVEEWAGVLCDSIGQSSRP